MQKHIKPKKIAFLPAHPSQIWVLYPVYQELKKSHQILWIIRNKDVMSNLMEKLDIHFILLSQAKSGILGTGIELFINIFKCMKLGRKFDISLWITQYGAGNIAARVTGKKSISFNDDDIDIAPIAVWLTYSFSNLVVTPDVTRVGRFKLIPF